MKTTTRWVLALTVVAIIFVLAWVLIPPASTKGSVTSTIAAPAPVAAPVTAYRSPGNRHKVAVTDSFLADSLHQQGARLVADYGSYKLFEVSSAVSGSLDDGKAQMADENNLVLLNSGTIDTTTPAAQAMRHSSSSSSGKQMRLIQFAGPIQPAWYEGLVRTGVKIVTYIPNNAYLVYGTSENLNAVQTLARTASVQWDGPYTSVHRLSRSITGKDDDTTKGRASKDSSTKTRTNADKTTRPQNTSAKSNELFAIQLVADKDNATTLALIDQLKLEPILRQANVLDYVNIVAA